MFIPIEKMKKLREAAKSGDANASRVLAMQMKGDDGLEDAVNAYFAQAEQPAEAACADGETASSCSASDGKRHWMDDSLAEEAQESQPSETAEKPETTAELSQGIVDLISVCDKTIMAFANGDEVTGAAMKGTMVTLQEIKQSLLDAMAKVKELKPKVETEAEQGL